MTKYYYTPTKVKITPLTHATNIHPKVPEHSTAYNQDDDVEKELAATLQRLRDMDAKGSNAPSSSYSTVVKPTLYQTNLYDTQHRFI